MIVQPALILILMIQIIATNLHNLNQYPLDVIIRLMDILHI